MADDKRGAHLALSVERLCQLSEEPITRIGLSATQRPLSEMARFLVGNRHIDADGNPDCVVVDTGSRRKVELSVALPEQELGPIATHEIWGETLDAIAGLTNTHAITLVFVNTRRAGGNGWRTSFRRAWGDEAVVAHHGSLSRDRRWDAEQKLKNGQVKVCVATASLELGIDIGEIGLVCQIGSPRSIGLLVQRVGRSGHTVGGRAEGQAVPVDQGRNAGVRRAVPGAAAGQPGHLRNSVLAAGRDGAADGGRLRLGRLGRGCAVRAVPAGLSLPGFASRKVRPGGGVSCPGISLPVWDGTARICTGTASTTG